MTRTGEAKEDALLLRTTEQHPEYGALIDERRDFWTWLVVAVLMRALVGVSAAAAIASYQYPSTMLVLAGMALVFLLLWLLARNNANNHLRFFERGFAAFNGRRVVATAAYRDLTNLAVGVTVQKDHGGHLSGIHVRISLRLQSGKVVRYAGQGRTKVTSFLRSQREILDPVDEVRDAIARPMSEVLRDRLLEDERVEWPKVGTLSAVGLTPSRGKRKGELIEFSRLEAPRFGDGVMELYLAGERKKLLRVNVGALNFWPCHYAFAQMLELHAEVGGGG